MADDSLTEMTEPAPTLWRRLLRWLPVLAVIGGGVLVYVLGASDLLTLSTIVGSRQAMLDQVVADPIGSVLIYAAFYIFVVVFSVPGGSFLTIFGGILFGGIVGGLVTTVAAAIGAVIVFLVARTALRGVVERRSAKLGGKATAIINGLRDNAFYVIVGLRLIPVMPFWASNAIPAIFGVRIDTYFWATLVGLLPWTVGFAFFGSALDELLTQVDPICAETKTCEIDFSAVSLGPVITGVAISALALVPVLWRWLATRREARRQAVRDTNI